MVKFSKELEANLIPEWKEAFVNYRKLKKHVKKIKLLHLVRSDHLPNSSDASSNFSSHGHRHGFSYGVSFLDPLRAVAARLLRNRRQDHSFQTDQENLYEMELVQSKENEMKGFMEKMDEELEKVNSFYTSKETEFCERREALIKQLNILLDLKQVLREHRRRRRLHRGVSTPEMTPLSPGMSPLSVASSFSENMTRIEEAAQEEVVEELMVALERNGVSFVGGRGKAKKGGKPRLTSLRIDIPPTTPGRTVLAICEDIVNGLRREEAAGGNGEYVTNKKIQYAEKAIRAAFVELYRALGLLKTYSSLNMVAFRKIIKKFDKVSNQQEASAAFLRKVKGSHFISSDKVVKLSDEVESIFTKHFAGNDKKKAMKFLRPRQPKESHMITFFVGLFTGSFATLFSVYALLAYLCGIFSSTTDYMETIYPVFSMFALLSLHIFLYGCNLVWWRSTRINHNFIFEFTPSTALKHRDAFLICASIMTAVVGAMVLHFLLRSAGIVPGHIDAIPGALLLLFTGILICPFNTFYRTTRYCFLRVIRNIILSPFYKVPMVDFFMADQLTSQIPLLRHIEFTACYLMAAGFKTHPYDTCTRSQHYKLLAYIISFLPYYWRAMQCARRYFEEGNDINHLANAGKYMSAMLAAATRMKYAVDPTPLWLGITIITCTGATFYQLYWDFVKDWGLLDMRSKNPGLRDELVLKNKYTYYVSVSLNFVLRLAWIGSVLHLSLGRAENRLVDFMLASLEIIRRGHWNFYRLENEHLNNVGKFRAVKAVPLPFRELDSDG